ncbi:pickpocket protein 11 [Anastrepha ludens]|uniref:pickpocket protein 11 n=1 Tax=Anastrepha ludens TaxID=28586 RepID=UPI0023B0D8EF|nr:pickpocket protein 11 [Anastrepha ludens]
MAPSPASLPLHAPHATRQAQVTINPPFVLGRAPWWRTTVPTPRSQRKRKISFAAALKDFLQNVSFHCYDKLVEPHRRFHERFFWIVFHITTLSVLVVFLRSTYFFDGNFLSTTIYDPLFPIRKVPFPTFSICSLNRISNASATRYAQKLQMVDPQKRGVNYFYNHIRKLSYAYTKEIDNDGNYEDILEFQNFLDIYDTLDTDASYNTRGRMREFYLYSYGNNAEVSSGAVTERLVETGMQTYVSIVPSIMETVNEARILPPSVRKCYFADEQPRVYGKKYSFNNCITRCRMHSMLVLCNCLIFTYPEHLLDVGTDFVYCTLRHKTCLERYYFKWSNVITERANIPGLEREMEDSLYCPQCLPLCSSFRYAVDLNALPLNPYNIEPFPQIGLSNISSFAVIKVYFGTSHIQYFRRILTDDWVEALGFIGNLVSIVTGFSLVGVCEVFYFFGHQLIMGFKSEMASDRKGKKDKQKTPLLILP